MSDALALSAVTATLRLRLDRAVNAVLPGSIVTSRPLDRARGQAGVHQVNLFLYHTVPNVAWRNVKAASPPLALNLYYLLSVHGANDDEPDPMSQVLLAACMKSLHEQPLLSVEELRGAFPGNTVAEQAERIRVTPQPLSMDEISKLWTIFQAPYRLSVAYEVSVVLIGTGGQPQREPRQ